MKVFTAQQIRNADLYTIEKEPVSSVQLMERAAFACANWLNSHSANGEKFLIFCGNGNNGGDGFATARLLYGMGFDVKVFVDTENTEYSIDSVENLRKIKEISGIEILDYAEVKESDFAENTTVVDALFGTGLNRKIEGKAKQTILFLNRSKSRKIAIDMPSGLLADEITDEDAAIFQADETLSFQFWKKTFLHPETGIFCGNVHILNIGLSENYIKETKTDNHVICRELVKSIYKPRKSFTHKGNYGKTCIVAGSFGKMGAAVLAVKSALRSGSGITYALAPKCGCEILQTSCPEAMYLYGGENYINHFGEIEDFTYGIGPGLGTDPETEESLCKFLKKIKNPLVLDADALNLIAKNSDNFNYLPKHSVITPHPKEFERLFGKTENSFQRLALAKEQAAKYDIFIVLKDRHTQIITPEGEVYYNITGNSGLAKGGSGDVLTGLITSLLAQHYTPLEASVLGVWLHGKSADTAAELFSKESLLASDVIDNFGKVFKNLM